MAHSARELAGVNDARQSLELDAHRRLVIYEAPGEALPWALATGRNALREEAERYLLISLLKGEVVTIVNPERRPWRR